MQDVSNMLKEERKLGEAKMKGSFGLEWKAEAREPLSAICVSSRKSKTQRKRASAWEVQSKEIERNTVRVWESEKEKGDVFLYSSYTQGR